MTRKKASNPTTPSPAIDVDGRPLLTNPIAPSGGGGGTPSIAPIAVDVKEASRILDIPVPTLNGWRSRGGGPRFARCGRVVRYPLEELRRFVAERVVGSTAEAAARDAAKDRD